MSRLCFLSFIAVLLLSACSSPAPEVVYMGQTGISAGRLTPYQQTLAAQLFATQQGLQRVAIASFVPADSLAQEGNKHTLLARQLQEGVLSEAHHYNVSVVEYRLTKQLNLSQQQERALSRETKELREQYRLDYMVVGTYTEVENGMLVNARLVNTRNATVLSAASVMVPWHAFEKTPVSSQWRRDGLYRQSVNEG